MLSNIKKEYFKFWGPTQYQTWKGGAFIQLEMRDLKSGSKVNERLRTSENIEKLNVNEISVTYLFSENNMITVMNNENYEQLTLNDNLLNGNNDFLEDGLRTLFRYNSRRNSWNKATEDNYC